MRRMIAPAASFYQSRFYDVDMSGSDLTEAGFKYCRFHHSQFRETSVCRADFSVSKIDHCDFSGAQLAGACLFRVEMNSCIFRDANLERCDFREGRMRGGDFRGANLRGAIGLTAEQLNQAIVDGSTILP